MVDFDSYWQSLIQLNAECNSSTNLACLSEQSFSVFTDEDPCLDFSGYRVVVSRSKRDLHGFVGMKLQGCELYAYYSSEISQSTIASLSLYLPLATTNMHSPDRTFVIGHMAQSLDGKVCTMSGLSQWIGNSENLIHAHRIRALVDGVLVGGETARRELPRLDVRHVVGENPARIILCNSTNELQDIPEVANARFLIVCESMSREHVQLEDLRIHPVEIHQYQSKKNENIANNVLETLWRAGMKSLLIEGGPITMGTFVSSRMIDILQLHIAPIIIGPGKSFATLSELPNLDAAMRLKSVKYVSIGDDIMVSGEI